MPSEQQARGSYRDRLDPSQRRAAERLFVRSVLAVLTPKQRKDLTDYYRYDAPGNPTVRGYVFDLLNGREVERLGE